MNAIAPGPFESKMMATTLDAMGEAIAEAAPLICDSTAVQDNVGEVVCETQRDDELAHASRPRSGPDLDLGKEHHHCVVVNERGGRTLSHAEPPSRTQGLSFPDFHRPRSHAHLLPQSDQMK